MMFILSGFGVNISKNIVPEQLKVNEPTTVSSPKEENVLNNLSISPPYLGKGFNAFKEALAFKESQGDYTVVNSFGYMGKYQFGINTLQLMGVYSEHRFLNDPALQEEAFKVNVSRNKWILRKDIKRFVGKTIKGVKITESGILAAAHLAGAGNVKYYLRSMGRTDVMDGYGSSIAEYIEKFSGYDLSIIPAVQNPRI